MMLHKKVWDAPKMEASLQRNMPVNNYWFSFSLISRYFPNFSKRQLGAK
jgi:hypothetical protein